MTLIEKIISEFKLEKEKAKRIIMAGQVYVNNEIIFIASYKLKKNDQIRIKERKSYVSRGAYKLIEALNQFDIEIENKICLDIGSSTGGFTQVLLEHKAKKIYALDSGTNQLDYSLRMNDKIISLEKTNLKSINKSMFDEKIDVITCDVSFISLTNIFDVINFDILNKENNLIALIKPQFEANYSIVEKGGYVDQKYHEQIIKKVVEYAKSKSFKLIKIINSPILGNKSKNIEYLVWFKLI